jgi:hypothetical protein
MSYTDMVSRAVAANGHEFCNNPKAMCEIAEQLGHSRIAISRMANVDPSTVRNWYKKNEAALKPIIRLAAELDRLHQTMTASCPVPPVQDASVTNPDNHTPFDTVSAVHLTPIQTGVLGEINAVLARFGKTLAVVDLQ